MTEPVESNLLCVSLPEDNRQVYNLTELVQRYFKSEAGGWLCDSCAEKLESQGPALRDKLRKTYFGPAWHHIARLPEIMFMQLARFQQHKDGTIKKNSLPVEIPESMSFAQYLDPDSHTEAWERVNPEYEVTGIISHSGTITSGHYKTHVLVDGSWFEINTKECEESTFEDAVGLEDSDWTPYILVWKRRIDTTDEEVAKLKKSNQAANGNAPNPAIARAPSSRSKRKATSVRDEVEDTAPPAKRPKQLPNLFPRAGDDPSGYPSIATRLDIQRAIDRAVHRYDAKWKDWQPASQKPRPSPASRRRSRISSPRPARLPPAVVTPSPLSRTSNPKSARPSPAGSHRSRGAALRKELESGGARIALPAGRRRSAPPPVRPGDVGSQDSLRVGTRGPRSVPSKRDQHEAHASLSATKRHWKTAAPMNPVSSRASEGRNPGKYSPSAFRCKRTEEMTVRTGP